MHRFFIARWRPTFARERAEADRCVSLLEKRQGYKRCFEWRGVMVAIAEDPRDLPLVFFPGDTGFVSGVLFDGAAPVVVDRALIETWCNARSRPLAEELWGAYFVLLIDRGYDRVFALRDPTGARACLTAHRDGIRFLFSDLAAYAAVTPGLTIDEERIAGFIAHPRLSLPHTAIKEVEELIPGRCVVMNRDDEEDAVLWRPSRDADISADYALAARCVHDRVQNCAKAWTDLRRPILHRLSGGLDSAITLSALCAHADAGQVHCVNEYSRAAPESDERTRARLCADAAGVSLIEVEMDPAEARLERAAGGPLLATPALNIFADLDDRFVSRTTQFGDALLTSGQGGDHIFHRSRTPLIGADAVRAGRGDFETLMGVSRLAGCSLWRTGSAALVHGLLRRPMPLDAYFPEPPNLVAATAAQSCFAAQLRHPWLHDWRKAPAGQTLRILQVLETSHYHAPNRLHERYHACPLLLSQPIIEACMNIPSWVMTQGGRERALVRQAFAKDIPAVVAAHTAKGETTRHFVAMLEHNWVYLRSILLDGALQRLSIINRPVLEAMLKPRVISDITAAGILLRCLAVELWLQRVSALPEHRAAGAA